MRIPIVCFFMFSLASLVFAQQTDTLLLHPEQLAERDIYDPLVSEKRKIKIVSGSRFPIEASDLPFSTHVITKEEIRRNGFETLVDALKYAPGIQVSQPGSALDGETFLMRGLLGNTYAKILVNDVPIKPTFSPSMPIGAQLPVKEAERIEIIYGAAAALYGADASAGVINIITRESEKPVFMQADLSIGSGVFSNMNVMFGGRLGRDKNLLKYFAYGSNTQMGNRNNTFNDVNLFRVTTYAPSYSDGQFLLKLPNHVGNEFRSLITNTPHQSRKIGFNIKYKRFIFSAEKLYRRDHSAIGFNPVAYSYSNPQTSTGESILRINLAIHKEREKRNKRTDFTYLRHQVDNRSSILPVRNRLALMLWQAANAEASNAGNSNVDSFFMRDYNKYMNGLRYMYGRSDEIRLEHLRNYRIMKDITLTFGLNLKAAWGYPNMSYLGRPAIEFREQAFDSSGSLFSDSLTFSIFPEWSIVLESNTFAQLFYNGNRLKLTVGINNASIGYSITEGGGPSEFFSTRSPRLAGLFKLTQNLNLYGSWGTAYRFSTPYHQRNSFFIFSDNYPKIQTGFVPHTPEKSAAWEGGLRFRNKNDRFGADLTLFSNKSTNLIRLGLLEEWAPDSSFYYGQLAYKNVEAASIRYTGGSLSMSTSFTLRQKRFSEGSISFSWINPRLDANEADIETFRLKQKKGSVMAFQNSFFLFRKSTFVLGLMRYKGVSTAYFPKEKDGFWTVDFTYRYAFTDRFDALLKVTNLLGVEYAGILPEADKADLLLYNPQQTQFIKLGMNYYIE